MALEIPLRHYIGEVQVTSRTIRSGIKSLVVPESTANTLDNMEVNIDNLLRYLDGSERSKAPTIKIIEKICSQARNVAKQLIKSKTTESVKAAAARLLELSDTLSHESNVEALHTGVVRTNHEEPTDAYNVGFRPLMFTGAELSSELQIKKLLEESQAKAAMLAQNITSLEVRTQEEIKKILANYERSAAEIELKSGEINRILGKLSGRAIAGDYEKSAAGEQRIADYLRWGSLFFMAVIAFALIYTFFETTNTEFDWQKSIFRISLTFLLSVPAAYLARESAKHREQQYSHLQTSLDLKAIPPFLATLTEEEQNLFKLEVARRIFGARETKAAIDSYPINTQEIIMALIKKTEGFSPAKKPNSKPSEE